MQTLPITLSIICAVGAFAGACAKIALENRKAARPSRENWTGFFVSIVFGLPVSLGGGEYLFHTQKWARESIWWLLMLSVVVGYNGLIIALETPSMVRAALARLVGMNQGNKKP